MEAAYEKQFFKRIFKIRNMRRRYFYRVLVCFAAAEYTKQRNVGFFNLLYRFLRCDKRLFALRIRVP